MIVKLAMMVRLAMIVKLAMMVRLAMLAVLIMLVGLSAMVTMALISPVPPLCRCRLSGGTSSGTGRARFKHAASKHLIFGSIARITSLSVVTAGCRVHPESGRSMAEACIQRAGDQWQRRPGSSAHHGRANHQILRAQAVSTQSGRAVSTEGAVSTCVLTSMSRSACPGNFCRDVWHTISRPSHPAGPLGRLERRNLNQRCRV